LFKNCVEQVDIIDIMLLYWSVS